MHDDDYPESRSDEKDDRAPAVIVIEQHRIPFWSWIFGERYINLEEAVRLEKEFEKLGTKVIILPPGSFVSIEL